MIFIIIYKNGDEYDEYDERIESYKSITFN